MVWKVVAFPYAVRVDWSFEDSSLVGARGVAASSRMSHHKVLEKLKLFSDYNV
jgi:hypothetical protein